MGPQAQLEKYAQKIYYTLKGRYYDDIASEDGQLYVDGICDATDMFLDELEYATDEDGKLIDWWFTRAIGATLGTATEAAASVTIPTSIERLIVDENRYVQITQGGIVVSNWAVVHPKDITNRSNRITEDMCAVVGNTLAFSRALRDTENNGIIIGDVVTKLPRLSRNNVKVLTTVRPQLLLILGVAKNVSLPDIVQGKLSPSYTQKYNELLRGAIARSTATSQAIEGNRQQFGGVGGIY
jgi:hypothetical protein